MLRRGWTLGTAQLIPLMHLVIRLSHGKQVDVLDRYWAQHRRDMVVSLIPHYNRALKTTLDHVWPNTPLVTVLTEVADYPPHFWIEQQERHVICGSEMAARQARVLGIPEPHVLRTSGMILNPRFYTPLNLNRRAERLRRGLRTDLPTRLVLFGGEGSAEMLRIAKALNQEDSGIQLILLCGKNEELADQLRAMKQHIPMFVTGFTRVVPLYMEIADLFIGKPGPGSISEALAKRLAVIVQRNAWTMAQERYNADWVEEMGMGLVVRNFAAERSHAGGMHSLRWTLQLTGPCRPASPEGARQNDVQQDSHWNGDAKPPCDSLECELAKSGHDAVRRRDGMAENSLSHPCKRDQQAQLQGRGQVIHQLKCRRVQSKYESRQQTQNRRTTIHGKCAEDHAHCEYDRKGGAGQTLHRGRLASVAVSARNHRA